MRDSFWPHRNAPDQIATRQSLVRERTPLKDHHAQALSFPVQSDVLGRYQECLTGSMVLPVAVVGPLLLELGDYSLGADGRPVGEGRSRDEVYVPLCHTEGGLSASLLRGARATAASGGIRTYVVGDRITRDSCFLFDTAGDALRAAEIIRMAAPSFQPWLDAPTNPLMTVATTSGPPAISHHARLVNVECRIVGTACHVLYGFTTGDAAGPNMMTRNAYALNHYRVLPLLSEMGLTPVNSYLEANLGGDKKPSFEYFHGGHGKSVIAEAVLTHEVLQRTLHIHAEDLIRMAHVGLQGSHAAGMQSFAFTPASAVAAIFAACGQDLGMVGTSSMAQAEVVPHPDGLCAVIRFPGLEVATVGGGTDLPHAEAYLTMMDCKGAGKVYRFAQIIAAAALCLDISAASSMATSGSRNFYETHLERGGRRRP